MSPDDSTIQSLVESTVQRSEVEIIISGIRIQINNPKYISLEGQKQIHQC